MTMYDMHYEADRKILVYRVVGYWDMSILNDFRKDIRALVADIKAAEEEFDVLSDSRAFAVQSTEVAAAIGALMPIGAQLTTGRKAFVVGGMIGKLQTERTLAHPTMRAFLSMDDARAWLASPREQPA